MLYIGSCAHIGPGKTTLPDPVGSSSSWGTMALPSTHGHIMTHRFLKAVGTLAVALVLLAGCDSANPMSSAEATADATAAGSTGASATSSKMSPGDIQGPDYFIPGCVVRYTINTGGESGTWIVPNGSTLVGTGFLPNGDSYADYSLGNFQKIGITWRYSNIQSKIVYRTSGLCTVLE